MNANDLPAALAAFVGLGVLLVVGYWAISRARGAVTDIDRPADRLEALRAALDAGQMSPEEFERARASIERAAMSRTELETSSPQSNIHGSQELEPAIRPPADSDQATN